jgi:methionine sulfoxide reductase heme-binding subunit
VSTTYRLVSWNPFKRRYDLVAGGLALVVLGLQTLPALWLTTTLTVETLLIRALGATAFLLLSAILCIGPLARLTPKALPLLYNRRHLGVMMFVVALAHSVFAVVQFHSFGTLDPLVSVLSGIDRSGSSSALPFQAFGLVALGVLFVMAATSHDFWLHNLTAPVWKAIHMTVYVAYALVLLHVLFGVVQGEATPVFLWIVGGVAATVFGLQMWAGRREAARDVDLGARLKQTPRAQAGADFVDVCSVDEIPEGRAITRCLSGERVAIFRYDGRISAVSNVCQHQNGPLGEGKIVRGCIVCPWHGYEYRPHDGTSPPPFSERIPTFDVRVDGRRVLVHPTPHPAGTAVTPAEIRQDDSR